MTGWEQVKRIGFGWMAGLATAGALLLTAGAILCCQRDPSFLAAPLAILIRYGGALTAGLVTGKLVSEKKLPFGACAGVLYALTVLTLGILLAEPGEGSFPHSLGLCLSLIPVAALGGWLAGTGKKRRHGSTSLAEIKNRHSHPKKGKD